MRSVVVDAVCTGRTTVLSVEAYLVVPIDPIDSSARPTTTRLLSVCPGNALGSTKYNLLLVEPVMTLRFDRERILSAADYCVTSVRNVREMFDLRFQSPIAFAVLNDLLGPFAMKAAAESVRRQWPLAKILVIGAAVPVLEDYLYDEVISHRHERNELLMLLQRLEKDWESQKTIVGHAGHRRAAATLNESDPPERIADTPAQTGTSHDLP